MWKILSITSAYFKTTLFFLVSQNIPEEFLGRWAHFYDTATQSFTIVKGRIGHALITETPEVKGQGLGLKVKGEEWWWVNGEGGVEPWIKP